MPFPDWPASTAEVPVGRDGHVHFAVFISNHSWDNMNGYFDQSENLYRPQG